MARFDDDRPGGVEDDEDDDLRGGAYDAGTILDTTPSSRRRVERADPPAGTDAAPPPGTDAAPPPGTDAAPPRR